METNALDEFKGELEYRLKERNLKLMLVNNDDKAKDNLLLFLEDYILKFNKRFNGAINAESVKLDCSLDKWEQDLFSALELNAKTELSDPETIFNMLGVVNMSVGKTKIPFFDTSKGVKGRMFNDWKDILYVMSDTDSNGILVVPVSEYITLKQPQNKKYKSRSGSFYVIYSAALGKYL